MKKSYSRVIIYSISLIVLLFVLSKSSYIENYFSHSPDLVWASYSQNNLGFTFEYPVFENTMSASIYPGMQGGESFHMQIRLPSGSLISVYASTKDYSDGKDAPSVGFEGYKVQQGKYYRVRGGTVTDIEIVPDEVLTDSSGQLVLFVYGKYFDPHADYPEMSAIAYRNLIPSVSNRFTGVGFTLSNIDDKGPHSASGEDIEIFKKMILSIR